MPRKIDFEKGGGREEGGLLWGQGTTQCFREVADGWQGVLLSMVGYCNRECGPAADLNLRMSRYGVEIRGAGADGRGIQT